jgi:hypothetical protein
VSIARLSLSAVMVTTTFAVPCAAQEEGAKPASPGLFGTDGRNYGNLRIGGSTGNGNGRPELCAEVSPLAMVAVEACGTGAGILHHDLAPEMAHFRGHLRIWTFRTEQAVFEPRLGAGFAEMQVGADDAGFKFGSSGPRRIETAGPEAAASLRVLVPVGQGVELVGNLNVGAAYLHYAPQLVIPQERLQPFAGAGIGVGF